MTPADWQMKRDGNVVSLSPSIGNWNSPCQSHYWIVGNRVEWSGRMSKQQIRHVQARDKHDKQRYVVELNAQRHARLPWCRRALAEIQTWWNR